MSKIQLLNLKIKIAKEKCEKSKNTIMYIENSLEYNYLLNELSNLVDETFINVNFFLFNKK